MSNDARFLNLPEGDSTCWATDVKFERGTNEKPRNKIRIYLAEKPSAETFDSPRCSQDIYLPMSSDTVQAKIAMERRIKAVLYPLAGFEPAQKCSIKSLFEAMQENLEKLDVQVEANVSHREGNTVDRDGNPRVFIELNSLTIVATQDKKAFESSITDDEEIPF